MMLLVLDIETHRISRGVAAENVRRRWRSLSSLKSVLGREDKTDNLSTFVHTKRAQKDC